MTSRIAFALSLSVVLFLSPIAWAGPDTVEFPEGKSEVTISLLRGNDHLLLPVQINGSEPALFILDTGAGMMGFADDFARSRNLAPISDATVNGNHASLCAVAEVSIAGVKFRQTFAVATDIGATREHFLAKQVEGLVGATILQSVPFTINWSQATLTLYKDKPHPNAGSVQSSLFFIDDKPAINARLATGVSGWFIIDTGADHGFMLDPAFARWNLHWLSGLTSLPKINFTLGGPRNFFLAQIADAELVGVVIPKCELSYPVRLDSSSDIAPPASGIIGQNVLKNLELTFDYKARLAWVSRDSHDGVPAEWSNPDFDATKADLSGFTPLMRAARMGRFEDVKRFLKAGAAANATHAQGATALHYASEAADKSIAELLIDAGAPVDAGTNHGTRPLQLAAEHGKADIVQLLLEKGAKVDADDNTGATPLICAAMAGNRDILAMLLKSGSDLKVISPGWGSALNIAVANGRTEAAKFLLESGADVDRTDRARTPLLFQAASGGSKELVSLLLDRKLDPNGSITSGQTPLFAAARNGYADILKLLIDRGADPTIKDKQGALAVTSALVWNHPDCARVLQFYHPSPTSKPAASGQ